MSESCIYVLVDPVTGDVRYVGWTNNPRQRLHAHISKARCNRTYKNHWIAKLLDEGVKPEMRIVETGVSEHKEAERRWIKHFRQLGARLTNLTDGGDGAPGCHPAEETRRKMSIAHTGRKQTPESTAKTVAALKGRKQTPEHIGKLAATRKGKPIPKATAAAAVVNRGKKQSPEHVAKRIEPLRGRIRPEFRKLSDQDVREIRAARGTMSLRELGILYGVGQTTIYDVLHGHSYSDVI